MGWQLEMQDPSHAIAVRKCVRKVLDTGGNLWDYSVAEKIFVDNSLGPYFHLAMNVFHKQASGFHFVCGSGFLF